MEQKKKNLNMQLLFLLSAVVILGAVVFLLVRNSRGREREAIVMPEQPVQQEPVQQTPPAEEEPEVLEVTRENVCQIVRSLSRPRSYHQTCEISIGSGESSYDYTAEIWVSNNLVRADLKNEFEIKSLLTDGSELYVWFDGAEPVRTLTAGRTLTMDDLIGIASYEDILLLPESAITQGEFITEERFPTGQQVYVAAEQNGVRQEYWVSLEYGLLSAFVMQSEDETIYTLTQTGLDVLAYADEAFENIFVLPDGTAPFKETGTPRS